MTTRRLIVISLLSLWIVACSPGGQNQEVEIKTPKEVKEEKKETPEYFDATFKDGMVGKVFNNYLEIQASLVNSDLDDARAAASNLAESFEQERAELKSIAQKMEESENLETFRRHFSDFTMAVEPLFTESISGGSIYKQYRPMAFNNEGAYWFADAEEIKNPYFGEKMLRCGSTKKVISKK